MKKWIGTLVLVVLLFGIVIGFNLFKQQKIAEFLANKPAPTFPVTTTKLDPMEWIPTIESIGFIEPYQGVTIRNEVAGKITDINFDSGDHMLAQQSILSLDTSVEEANLAQAKAQLPALKASMIRMVKLHAQSNVSEEQRDESVANFDTKIAEISSLKATIARRKIRAPFSGETGIRKVYLGQYLNAGSEIVRLEDNTTMRIRFIIPQTDIDRVKVGQNIEVKVDALPNEDFRGVITAIDTVVSYQSGVIQLQADIPNQSRKLKSGMFARVQVILPVLEHQLVLPQTAINFTLYGETVYVVSEQQTSSEKPVLVANQVTVKVEERRGDIARITGGLKAGDQVVTSGQVRLSSGSLVKVVENSALNTPEQLPAL